MQRKRRDGFLEREGKDLDLEREERDRGFFTGEQSEREDGVW